MKTTLFFLLVLFLSLNLTLCFSTKKLHNTVKAHTAAEKTSNKSGQRICYRTSMGQRICQ
jgi:preprotein translocase subunit SecG